MKYLLVLLMFIAIWHHATPKAITTATNHDENSEWAVDAIGWDCLKQTGLSKEEVVNEQWAPDGTLTQAKKCYAKCIFQKAGYIEENGNIRLDLLKSYAGLSSYRALQCLENLEPVKKCEDIIAFRYCYNKKN